MWEAIFPWHLRLKKVENLNDREALLMKVIHKALPKYLGEDGYSTIQGFMMLPGK